MKIFSIKVKKRIRNTYQSFKYKAEKAQLGTVIAPVAAIDKFFGNLRIQLFLTLNKNFRAVKKLSDLSNTKR